VWCDIFSKQHIRKPVLLHGDGGGEHGDTASCFVVRYTKKSSGYYHAGITITRCLLLLRRKLNSGSLSVNILPVPPMFLDVEAEALSVHATFM